MNKISKFIIILILFCQCNGDNFAQNSLNLDFELKVYDALLPKIWYTEGDGISISLDSLEKHNGKFSLKIETHNKSTTNGTFIGRLPIETFAGKNIEYKGWIKTKELINGYAKLWFSVDDANGEKTEFNDIHDYRLTGDNDWTQVSIKMDLEKDLKNIRIGGIFTGEGIAWFDDLELYINGEKYIDNVNFEKTSLSQKEISEIKKYIYPLSTFEPDNTDTKDLKVLNKLIGNSKVVALGEVSHGSSEIFKMKNRIFQYMAANNGFDIFSIEANMPESYKLNNYTVRGEGDPKKLISDMIFWTWNTEEMLNMVEWMRKFNQHKKRIEFTGFDMQFYEGAVNELFDAFKENEEVYIKIADLKKMLYQIINLAQQKGVKIIVSDNEMNDIESIISFLQHNIETLTLQTFKKKWLQQNITIIKQSLGYYTGKYIWRDKCMADNFMWINENNPNSKFIIWAHNIHIMKTDHMMGSHLAQKLGDDYVTFGFTFFDGNFTAFGSKGITSYEAAQAYHGTLEYLLNQLNEPIFILDLKKIKSDKHKDTEWLLERLDYRCADAVAGGQFEFQNRKISTDFDYLIFIKTSTPSVLFPDTQ